MITGVRYDQVKDRKIGDLVVIRRSDGREYHGLYGRVISFNTDSRVTARINVIGHESNPKHARIGGEESFMIFKYDYIDESNPAYLEIFLRPDEDIMLPTLGTLD
jgi:hypothetical protein